MPSLKKVVNEELQKFVNELESPLDPNYNGVMSNIPQGYDGGILNETGAEAQINITPVEPDFRSGKNQPLTYKVSYYKEVNGEPIEIEGTLKPYHTGRTVEYGFEPGYFTDDVSATFWDENWEAIEDEIRSKFYAGGMGNA
jgi:hypothetical protein